MLTGKENDQRTSVLREYASATAEHYVGELELQRGHLPKQKYDELYVLVEEAPNECEPLRKKMKALPPEDGSSPL
jgi:hypothetical protein